MMTERYEAGNREVKPTPSPHDHRREAKRAAIVVSLSALNSAIKIVACRPSSAALHDIEINRQMLQ